MSHTLNIYIQLYPFLTYTTTITTFYVPVTVLTLTLLYDSLCLIKLVNTLTHQSVTHTNYIYLAIPSWLMPGGVRTLKVLHISVLIKGYYQHLGCTTYPILLKVNFSDAQNAHFVRIDITVINPNLRQSLCNNVIGAQDRNITHPERTTPLH